MTDKQALITATLKWCNKMRAEVDMEPLDALPKGKRRDSISCPCGKATGLFVGGRRYGELNARSLLPLQDQRDGVLPKSVKRFVLWFDAGLFPDLIEEN